MVIAAVGRLSAEVTERMGQALCRLLERYPADRLPRTTLDDRRHHRRVHDPDHTTIRLPDGSLRFHRRTSTTAAPGSPRRGS